MSINGNWICIEFELSILMVVIEDVLRVYDDDNDALLVSGEQQRCMAKTVDKYCSFKSFNLRQGK